MNALLRDHGMEDIGEEDTPTFDRGGEIKITEADLPDTETDKHEVAQFPLHSIVGKLWWLGLISRPDIVFAVHRCACWHNRPSKKLLRWVVRIVKYSKQTKSLEFVHDR